MLRNLKACIFLMLLIALCIDGAYCQEDQKVKLKVNSESDRVWLEGIEGFSFEDYGSSVHGAQATILKALGTPLSYEYLLGISGLAFRMQVFKDALCPSSPHSCCGFMCVSRSTTSNPWNIKIYEVKPEDAEKVQELRNAVKDSIDRGFPLQYGSIEDGIIIGYQKDGEEWLCYDPLQQNGKKIVIEKEIPWGVVEFVSKKDSLPSKKELAVESLKQAVEMTHQEDADEYWLGFRAWEEYIKYLQKLNENNELIKKDDMMGNAWIYECLISYRLHAVNYLRGLSQGFYEESEKHLLNAADLYEKMVTEKLLDEQGCFTDFVPYPWMQEKDKKWSNEMRTEQIRRLQEALQLEKHAITEIETALAKM